jgi:hypothetical protein
MDDSIIVLSSLQFSDMEKYMGSEFRAVVLLLKDNVQLLAELPVRKLPDIMTLSQERKRMPPMMWA